MKLKILAILATSLTVSTSASAVNLIANGDFESSPFVFGPAYSAGFGTEYTQVPYPSAGASVPESTVAVGADPSLNHPYFVQLTGSTNNMLLVNGATGGDNKAVLTYSSPLLGPGNYVFNASVMDICCNSTFTGNNSPSTLLFQFSDDGGTNWDPIVSYTTSPGSPGDTTLKPLTASGTLFHADAPFIFRIIDAVTAAGGNDFAVDNLSIVPAAVPGPVVGAGLPGLLMALGGLVVLARRRRNQIPIA